MIPTRGKSCIIDNADYRFETITDLMTLQDQIESFQTLIFSNFRGSANNECRISALVPLVKESFGIYKFITSMLRAMYRRKCASERTILIARYRCYGCSFPSTRTLQRSTL